MRLARLRLKAFKRFHDLDIDLGATPAKIVALVGPNGSGKSSIFDAFEEKAKDYKGANSGPPPDFLGRNYFVVGPGAEPYQRANAIQLTPQNSTQTFSKNSFYIRTSYRFTPRLNIAEMRTQPDILDDVARPGSSIDLDSRLTENYQRLQANMLDEWDSGTKSGPQYRDEQVGRLNGILERVLDVRVSSLGSIIGAKGKLYFEKGAAKNFPYDNLSAGEKEVIDILLDLFVKVDRYNDTVYAIDEPELHLNTAIQRRLIVEIEKLIPDTCQLWIATHSIGFLRALQVELQEKTALIDLTGVDLDSAVKLTPTVTSRSTWTRLFSTALDDLTGLVAPKTLIYCEGRATPGPRGEELGLDADVYNTIFGFDYPDTLFVSSGGSTEPKRYASVALSVLSKAFVGAQLLLLKDRDINADGSLTTAEQRQAWLNAYPATNRMLARREIENYLIDWEIVSKLGDKIPEDQHRAIVGDIVNDDQKPNIPVVMRAFGHLTGLSADAFKRQLASKVTRDTAIYRELEACIFSPQVPPTTAGRPA